MVAPPAEANLVEVTALGRVNSARHHTLRQRLRHRDVEIGIVRDDHHVFELAEGTNVSVPDSRGYRVFDLRIGQDHHTVGTSAPRRRLVEHGESIPGAGSPFVACLISHRHVFLRGAGSRSVGVKGDEPTDPCHWDHDAILDRLGEIQV